MDPANPDTVFLTCADSRILPDVITASKPGDLYIVRNVGNLVPIDPTERSVDAALDFAVNQLGVSSVVVCGHSSCRSMQALLDNGASDVDRPMNHWLEHAHDSLAAFRDGHPARASAASVGFGELDQLAVVNVAVQLERLAHNQVLAPAIASGAIQIVGMFFDFSTVHVHEVEQLGIVASNQPVGKP